MCDEYFSFTYMTVVLLQVQLNLSELSIAMVTSEPGLPRLTLHETHGGARAVLGKNQLHKIRPCVQLVYTAEKDMEDWLASLNTGKFL
jgi:hypothetical protein